ncbi:cytochrome b5 domain-containing protein [Clostridium lundense]|uniref:cytochrome b5 domain-containing protein n=1 Tax=Clostridium lundense TaxID=319475 RepID=UPI000A49C4DF|nr:cytochrome b5 domain-containing protein [Clostridium lundense]
MHVYCKSEGLIKKKKGIERNYYIEPICCRNCVMRKACDENLLFLYIMNGLKSITEIYRHMQDENINVNLEKPKEFTLEELSKYDGTMGKPAYVAVNGTVYDVSNEASWGGASHFGLIAGKDLTAQFNGCHGNASILSNLPKVGTLKS